VGSQSYISRVSKFPENNLANIERIRNVFAEAGLGRDTAIYVVQREMFHIFMIEENGELRVLTRLHRERG
jgi:hypothetical protein